MAVSEITVDSREIQVLWRQRIEDMGEKLDTHHTAVFNTFCMSRHNTFQLQN